MTMKMVLYIVAMLILMMLTSKYVGYRHSDYRIDGEAISTSVE